MTGARSDSSPRPPLCVVRASFALRGLYDAEVTIHQGIDLFDIRRVPLAVDIRGPSLCFYRFFLSPCPEAVMSPLFLWFLVIIFRSLAIRVSFVFASPSCRSAKTGLQWRYSMDGPPNV